MQNIWYADANAETKTSDVYQKPISIKYSNLSVKVDHRCKITIWSPIYVKLCCSPLFFLNLQRVPQSILKLPNNPLSRQNYQTSPLTFKNYKLVPNMPVITFDSQYIQNYVNLHLQSFRQKTTPKCPDSLTDWNLTF